MADHIETKSMEIGGILVGNKIVSPKGDIAYHFAINDGDSFEEGEVVGFQTNITEDHPKIIKLTASNADQVVLKGVITRSQYFEAKKPKDSTGIILLFSRSSSSRLVPVGIYMFKVNNRSTRTRCEICSE